MKTPVVIFLFKRHETLKRILSRVKEYKPNKLYLLGDGPRNDTEYVQVKIARETALKFIDWPCEVITKFSETNIGVYENIGIGSKWVLEREKTAIFLEDDNYPETTFFEYCDSLLIKYANNPKVLWICGTNYMGNTADFGEESYYYTRHLLPCGWASWSDKFLKNYDGDLSSLNNQSISVMESTYTDRRLFLQELQTVKQTKFNLLRNPKSVSWDRQMCFSLRSKLLYGIAPHKNQIKNIGVDEHSVHGGTSLSMEMTSRFCERDTFQLQFPLITPKEVDINLEFEKKTSDIILYPFKLRLKRYLGRIIKKIIGLDPDDSIVLFLRNRKK